MQFQPVKSSMIEAIGYEDATGVLAIRFSGGREYQHQDVAPELVDEMLAAESVGKFYNAHIKGKFAGAVAAELPQAPVPLLDASSFTTPEDAIETALAVAATMRQIQIANPSERGAAADTLVTIAKQIRAREEFFLPMKEAANKAHKAICAKEKEAIQPLLDARAAVTGAMRTFDQAEERARREEEARLRKLEQDRYEAALQQAREEAAIRDAEEHTLFGREEEAEAVLNHPPQIYMAPAATIVLPRNVPQTAGVSARRVWKFRVEQEHLVPREFMAVDEAKVRKVVAALGASANIPGVVVYEEQAYTVNTRRA